jgi:formylglycine-generating enzyme required for sulfatase activity
MRRGPRLLFLGALASCQSEPAPKGQIVLYIDTDAPVPGDEADPLRLEPLVDRARIEVLADNKLVPGSSRDFEVNATLLRERKLSFGIALAAHDPAVSVRVRLFRTDRVYSEELSPGVTLDTTVTLPSVAEEGISEVHVFIKVDDFGKTLGPIPASAGKPIPAPTWRNGRRAPCEGTPQPAEACVPGGAFFLGDPAFRGRTPANDVSAERLVWISPFFLDRTEVTVGAFREAWPRLAASAAPPAVFHPPSPQGSNDFQEFCTWTESPTTFEGVSLEELPINCLTWATARAFCRDRGADLPTEAQVEYVASGLGAERAYPWGADEAECTEAIWGRGGQGAYADGSKVCVTPGRRGWLAFPGSGTRDRIKPVRDAADDAEIVDLGGNVTEWALDTWNDATQPFWASVLPMLDPVATTPSVDGDDRPVRGGSWPLTVLTARAAFRGRRAASTQAASVGFRCARPATGSKG